MSALDSWLLAFGPYLRYLACVSVPSDPRRWAESDTLRYRGPICPEPKAQSPEPDVISGMSLRSLERAARWLARKIAVERLS